MASVCPSVCVSVTSNSSLSLEASEGWNFPHINAKKVANQIFEFLSRGWDIRVFLSLARHSPSGVQAHASLASIWGVSMQNFSPLASKLREEKEVTDGHAQRVCRSVMHCMHHTDHGTKIYHICKNLLRSCFSIKNLFPRGGYAFFNVWKMQVYLIIICCTIKLFGGQGGQVGYHPGDLGSTPPLW